MQEKSRLLERRENLPTLLTTHCSARIGLMGNPSDGFGGKTISFLIENFRASVTLSLNPSTKIEIIDPLTFDDFRALLNYSKTIGFEGSRRLLQATCKVFAELCSRSQLDSHLNRGFTIQCTTNIPRMVGLSGSSAIIVAAFRGLLEFHGLSLEDLHISQNDFPQVILDIERVELGIAAGLQDRVIQVYGGLVHMDFSHPSVPPTYTPLPLSLLPNMYLAYDTLVGGDSGKVHSTVKQRWQDRDPELVSGMAALGSFADLAVDYLKARDFKSLAALAEKNFATRRRLYGDAVVGERNLRAVLLAASLGLSAKFTGSGGALLCLRTDGNSEWLSSEEEVRIKAAFKDLNFEFERIILPNEQS